MGKHSSNGISYFNIDCVQEDNLNYIEAKHGITGYGVLVKLWRKIYMVDGYFCQWSDKNVYLFSKEVAVPVEQINEVVESCLNEKIFSREMYDKFQVLTSTGVQKRWLKIVTEAKRKNREIDKNLSLLEKTTEQEPKTPEFLPQRKVKESKEKKSKKLSAPPTAAPPKVSKVKNVKQPEPYWQDLVKCFFDFYSSHFKGEKPSFDGELTRKFKTIIHRLKSRAVDQNIEWTNSTAVASLNDFLKKAFQDKWLRTHFTIGILLNHFDSVFQQSMEPVITPVPVVKLPSTDRDRLNLLFEFYKNGELEDRQIDDELFDKLVTRYNADPNIPDRMPGVTIEEKKRNAVREFFRQKAELKKQEVPA